MTFQEAFGRRGDSQPAGSALSDRMRERTRELHNQAERSGIVRDLLLRQADRQGYALHLRGLLPVYAALETGLRTHADSVLLRELARPELYREAAILGDLTQLCGADWQIRLPMPPAAKDYADRIDTATAEAPALLIAHVYVRYLGDLNGGRILRQLLARSLDLDDRALGFYDFPQLGDLNLAAVELRSALDRAGSLVRDQLPVIEEAANAFSLSIALSEAVKSATGGQEV